MDVHAKAREVLGFWFELAMPEQWFGGAGSFDTEVAELFGPLRDLVLGSGAEGWRDDPETLLAAVIVLDQFSRNIHRGTAQAFAADPLALELTREAMAKGWDEGVPAERCQFLYMPLMHSEDSAVQAESVKRFTALGDEKNLRFAKDHAGVIEKYGRFPSRNAALGRESTPAEKEYLSQPDAGW